MKPPIFVRTLSKEEREALEAGLRSSDAFVLRRCQILLASARRERPPGIAENLGCGSQTVRNAIHAFDQRGWEALREMLHHNPRKYGKQSSLWTLRMAAEVSFEEGITERPLSGESIRAKRLQGLGCAGSGPNAGWRAPIRSTPAKRGSRSADQARPEPPRVGFGL